MIMARAEQSSDKKSTAEVTTLSRRESIALIATTLLKNPAAILRFWIMSPNEERYVSPPRSYELPVFRKDMRHCTSDEEYLRPTPYCNPREPVVIAMANKLGAYEKTDYEFAEAAFDFVTHNLRLSVCPFNGAGATLESGTGSCWELMSVFIALCRAAGIKARYMGFPRAQTEEDEETMSIVDPLFARLYVAMADIGGLAEAYVDGAWINADLVASPEMQAVRGLPIKRFEEGLIASKVVDNPLHEWHSESIPSFAARSMQMLKWFAPAMYQRINVGMLKQYTIGRKIIEDAGGIEAYDQRARERWELTSPIIVAEDNPALEFVD